MPQEEIDLSEILHPEHRERAERFIADVTEIKATLEIIYPVKIGISSIVEDSDEDALDRTALKGFTPGQQADIAAMDETLDIQSAGKASVGITLTWVAGANMQRVTTAFNIINTIAAEAHAVSLDGKPRQSREDISGSLIPPPSLSFLPPLAEPDTTKMEEVGALKFYSFVAKNPE